MSPLRIEARAGFNLEIYALEGAEPNLDENPVVVERKNGETEAVQPATLRPFIRKGHSSDGRTSEYFRPEIIEPKPILPGEVIVIPDVLGEVQVVTDKDMVVIKISPQGLDRPATDKVEVLVKARGYGFIYDKPGKRPELPVIDHIFHSDASSLMEDIPTVLIDHQPLATISWSEE